MGNGTHGFPQASATSGFASPFLGVFGIWWKIDDHSTSFSNGAHGFPPGSGSCSFGTPFLASLESGGKDKDHSTTLSNGAHRFPQGFPTTVLTALFLGGHLIDSVHCYCFETIAMK